MAKVGRPQRELIAGPEALLPVKIPVRLRTEIDRVKLTEAPGMDLKRIAAVALHNWTTASKDERDRMHAAFVRWAAKGK